MPGFFLGKALTERMCLKIVLLLWLTVNLKLIVGQRKRVKIDGDLKRLIEKNYFTPRYPSSSLLGGECYLQDFQFQAQLGGSLKRGISVHKAFHMPSNKTVALKLFNRSYYHTRLLNLQTVEEILHGLGHRGVMKHYCSILADDQIAFVLEYIDGITLEEHLRAPTMSGISITKGEIESQLADILAYLGRQGIGYRDLIQANVMLTRTPKPVVKLINWGLATFTKDTAKDWEDFDALKVAFYLRLQNEIPNLY